MRITSEQFLGLFADHRRQRDLDFNKLITPNSARAQARSAPPAQPKPLTGLRAWRNSQQRLTVNGRHFYLRAERGFGHSDGHTTIDIVPLPLKVGVLTDVGYYIKVARHTAEVSSVPLAGDPNTGAGIDAGRYSHQNRLAPGNDAVPLAGRAGRRDLAAAGALTTF